MRLSHSLVPTLKETPAEAQIASHRLMLRAGLVRQTSAGIYAWLPTGWRVLQNISRIVREEQDRVGAQEMLMPTIQSADLWRRSGRYDAYGPEMLRLKDRGDREMLYGPTNEEMITDLVRQSINSYRQLPQIVYHIQWKFRDETRPRFGVMRGREFLMKDGYSFDLDYAGAVLSYRKMMLAYMRTFQRMGLSAIPMAAESGPIGGDLSHEFIVLAPTGESQVFYDAAFDDIDYGSGNFDATKSDDLERFFQMMTTQYAATDEMHDASAWAKVDPTRRREGRGIEVGHIFYFGTKYSAALDLSVTGHDGKPVTPEMGSYGVGVSRLVGALIEASHDDAGIVWPDAVAPFAAAILNLKQGDPNTDRLCEQAYAHFAADSLNDALYDDREERAGPKFADADLMGHPWQLIIGPRGAANGTVELKRAPPASAKNSRSKPPCPRSASVAEHVRPLRARRRRPLPARPPRRALRLRHRRPQPRRLALGVATLIIVMSVMGGFQVDLLNRILGFNGHLSVYPTAGRLQDYDATANKIRAIPGIIAATPVIDGQVAFSNTRGQFSGGFVRGVEPGHFRDMAAVKIADGNLADFQGEDAIAIGTGLANKFGLAVGDYLTLTSPQGAATAFGTIPRQRAYKIAILFTVGMNEYDNAYVFLPLPAAQIFFQSPSAVSQIEVRIADPDDVRQVGQNIAAALAGLPVRIIDWRQNNNSFFAAVKVEQNVMFLILTLIIIVAAFNVISSLIMMVKDKTRDIAVLRTFGAGRGAVMRIFLMCGASVGVTGTLVGVVLGTLFCLNIETLQRWVEDITGANVFNPEVYYLTHLPAKLNVGEVTQVVVMALGLSLLATLYPSWRAARTDPVEALRHE